MSEDLLSARSEEKDAEAAAALAREITKTKLDKVSDAPVAHKDVVLALKTIFDPEVPVNIYDLGLIYEIEIEKGGVVKIVMTLTSPLCPIADEMPHMVADAVLALVGVNKVKVKIVWDPAWDLSMISDEGRFLLDMI